MTSFSLCCVAGFGSVSNSGSDQLKKRIRKNEDLVNPDPQHYLLDRGDERGGAGVTGNMCSVFAIVNQSSLESVY